MILDTNALAEYLSAGRELSRLVNAGAQVHLTAISLGEFRFGLLRSQGRRRLETLLDSLERTTVLLPVTEATARTYAVVRNELRLAGTPIPSNDMWIASLARQHGLPVVSRDAHFDHVNDLERIGW